MDKQPAIHPAILDWIDRRQTTELLYKLRRAEELIGDFGTITITYAQGKFVKMECVATKKDKL